MIRRALLIANPAARRGIGQLGNATKAFDRANVDHDVVLTERAGHAAEITTALYAKYDAVFALGGDGTAMEVAGALAGTMCPVGALPGGTGNLLARATKTPLRVDHAVTALLNGRDMQIDLGRLGDGRRFAIAAGIGIDATMILDTPTWFKRRAGVVAYATMGTVGAVRTIAGRSRIHARITVDGVTEEHTAATIMIANFGDVLGDRLTLGPTIAPDDGMLDVCIFSPRSLIDGIGIMHRMVSGNFADHPLMAYRRGAHIRIETETPHAAQADGELLGTTPLDITVEPRAVRLLVPRDILSK